MRMQHFIYIGKMQPLSFIPLIMSLPWYLCDDSELDREAEENRHTLDTPFAYFQYNGELNDFAKQIAYTGDCLHLDNPSARCCDSCFMILYNCEEITDFRLK